MYKKRILGLLLAICVILLLIAVPFLGACGGTETVVEKVIYRAAVTADPSTLNILKASKLVQATAMNSIFEPLVLSKENGSVIP
ncbi:MAG: hypothetical protein NTV30_06705 [Chloroflexi bacterium]|nr:hypothetical protein [Chloroflexota bacterium]